MHILRFSLSPKLRYHSYNKYKCHFRYKRKRILLLYFVQDWIKMEFTNTKKNKSLASVKKDLQTDITETTGAFKKNKKIR